MPPTPVTSGSDAGQFTTGLVKNVVPATFEGLVAPQSPEPARTVTLSLAASV